jgi:hypothetical protein
MFPAPAAKRPGIARLLWNTLQQEAIALDTSACGVASDPQAVTFDLAMGTVILGDAPSGSLAGRLLPKRLESLAQAKIAAVDRSPPSRVS